MKAYPSLRVPPPRPETRWSLRSRSLVKCRGTIRRDGKLVFRPELVLSLKGILYRRVPAALPLKRVR